MATMRPGGAPAGFAPSPTRHESGRRSGSGRGLRTERAADPAGGWGDDQPVALRAPAVDDSSNKRRGAGLQSAQDGTGVGELSDTALQDLIEVAEDARASIRHWPSVQKLRLPLASATRTGTSRSSSRPAPALSIADEAQLGAPVRISSADRDRSRGVRVPIDPGRQSAHRAVAAGSDNRIELAPGGGMAHHVPPRIESLVRLRLRRWHPIQAAAQPRFSPRRGDVFCCGQRIVDDVKAATRLHRRRPSVSGVHEARGSFNPRTGPSSGSCRRARGWSTAAPPGTRSAPRCGARI